MLPSGRMYVSDVGPYSRCYLPPAPTVPTATTRTTTTPRRPPRRRQLIEWPRRRGGWTLVLASVGISVLNWSSLPTGLWPSIVAGAIAFGLEGAKLVLIPFGFVMWKGHRAQAISALMMGALITGISVGGIVIWLDDKFLR